eukprot:gene47388-58046_t
MYNSLKRKSKRSRAALSPPDASPWRKLLSRGDAKSFLTMTGMTRCAFRLLLQDLWDVPNPPPSDRSSLLTNEDKLGLILFYLGSKMTLSELSILFGVSVSLCGEIVVEMLELLCKRLKNHPDAKISFPGPEKKAEYAAMIYDREPTVDNCIGFIDSCSVATQCSDNADADDAIINNLFAFAPDGKIVFACINYAGSLPDTAIFSELINVCLERKKLGDNSFCVDEDFPRSGDLYSKLIGPISEKKRKKLARRLHSDALDQFDVYSSLRLASDWGMNALQGTFSRLQSPLSSDSKKRLNILLSIVLLHNFRTAHVGLKQI